jgi:hypothetical protein
MRVFIVMGYPIAGWFIREHLFLKWMMKSGSPWYPYFRKLHMCWLYMEVF